MLYSKNTSNPSSTQSNSLIVGAGEVGRALLGVLSDYSPICIDINDQAQGEFTFMHICFPYSKDFVKQVKQYQKKYTPKFTIIHSTVPIGTSRRLKAIHSPIRGIHPNLVEGIKTFPKFLGGKEASLVADYFRRAGLKVILVDKPETTEAGKLFDTEYYRVCIEFTKRVNAYCLRHGLNFHEVYTLFNQTYNEGYEKLDMPEVRRPVLQPIMAPIGGHCVIPNSKLINYE